MKARGQHTHFSSHSGVCSFLSYLPAPPFFLSISCLHISPYTICVPGYLHYIQGSRENYCIFIIPSSISLVGTKLSFIFYWIVSLLKFKQATLFLHLFTSFHSLSPFSLWMVQLTRTLLSLIYSHTVPSGRYTAYTNEEGWVWLAPFFLWLHALLPQLCFL